MRVGIVGLLHESNTFIQQYTRLEHFQRDLLLTGGQITDQFADAHHEIGGFLAGLSEHRLDVVPLFFARALPFGPIVGDDFRQLMEQMERQVKAAGSLDGVLAAAHGATVAVDQPDADGCWLGALRRWMGADLPLICTVDPHANLSPALVQACDAILAYQTNPHVDQHDCGRRAATLMAATLRQEVRPVVAAAFPPLAINIERQNTSEPLGKALIDDARRLLQQQSVLASSVCLGFPYADVAQMGSAAVVVTDADRALAQSYARELGRALWQRRHDSLGQLLDEDAALALARQRQGPVGLLDMGDNVGGGSPADGTVLAHALQRHQLGPSFVCLYDPEAVAQLSSAEQGQWCQATMGGKTDALHGPPLAARVRLIGRYDGTFHELQTRHGGFRDFDQGLTVVVRTDDHLTIMLTSRRMPPFSLQQLTSCQVDPTTFRFLVIKGVHAPIAAYRDVCQSFIRVNTPGVTCADMERLAYRHRRRPMFPFERDAVWVTDTCSGPRGQLE